MRTAIKIWSGTKPVGCVYTPQAVIRASIDVVNRYLDPAITEMIIKKEVIEGKKLCKIDKQKLYIELGQLWTRSEERQKELIALKREQLAQYRGLPLGVMHKDRNTTIRLQKEKAQELVNILVAIDKLIDKAFAPKKFSRLEEIAAVREVYKQQSVSEIV